MLRKRPIIQDNAVIAKRTKGNPIGEALRKEDTVPVSPMAAHEREEMLSRLEKSISTLMDDAERTYQKNCHKPGTTDVDPDYITRLSTNEFFFYTKEPLTLNEFEKIQNKITTKAQALSPGVQLILGSFAVKTDAGKVMNVTPHITCGKQPDFQFIVKKNTSSIDVRYKMPDGRGDTNTLRTFDKKTYNPHMPEIIINETTKKFSFNNIISCKTPGGTPFVTAVDICLDHAYGVAKKNYKAFAKNNPDILKQPISHVVVSNCITVNKTQCLGAAIMHVDPRHSPKKCKKNIRQQKGTSRKFEFGNDFFKIFEVAPEKVHYRIDHNYAHKISDHSAGRDHKSYMASLSKINFQNHNTSEFKEFKQKYQEYEGDYLKTQILEDMKDQINETTSKKELDKLKEKLKTSYEYTVLKIGQGWFTQKADIKTSSIKALENMFKQQETYLDSPKKTPSI